MKNRSPKRIEIENYKIEFCESIKIWVDSPDDEYERIINLVKSKSKEEFKFKSEIDFAQWWATTLCKQNGKCYYCESLFSDIRKLISLGLIKTRKLKGNAVRGPNPEPDRLLSLGNENIYTEKNCVLACYYCNNDKSNVYDYQDYKLFLAPAKGKYIEYLIGRIK